MIIFFACMVSACDFEKAEPLDTRLESVLDASVVKENGTAQSKSSLFLEDVVMSSQKNMKFVLPSCTRKSCIRLDLPDLETQDEWLNQWMQQRQIDVLVQQIDIPFQTFTLQQAVNRYAKASEKWQQQQPTSKAFFVQLESVLLRQNKGIVLLQIKVNSHQAGTKVQDRIYFFVADRQNKTSLSLQKMMKKNQNDKLQLMLKKQYEIWLKQQDQMMGIAPKKLPWQSGEWFFDAEGIGLHFRVGEVAMGTEQLDIYLSRAQTKQVLKPEIYHMLFE